MKKQLSFEDVKVGDEIPPLTKRISLVQMVMYAAATWDFHRHHYDYEFVRGKGFPAPFVDGQMLGAFLAQMVTSWKGEEHTLKKLSFGFREMAFPGDVLTCRGKVADKFTQEGKKILRLELWIENQKGHLVVSPASALVSMGPE
jgi:acyl dehydratase